jgi:hypothetical protein
VPRLCRAVVIAAVVVAGCSGGSDVVIRDGSVSAPRTTPRSSSPSPSGARHPVVKVIPARGLRDRQSVLVRASGFAPGEPLTVIECAAKGNATGPGDCDLAGMLSVSADGAGRLATHLTVRRGPFGANGVVCSVKRPCLVSVTQASLTPQDEADTPISFAPR